MPLSSAAQAVVAATSRREPVVASNAASVPVTRDDFNRLMVPCYAPALFVPCHRVLRSDGSLGGFAWGLDVKRSLLDREAAI